MAQVAIQTTEKVPRRFRLIATGTSGHGSVPLQSNPIARLARAITAVTGGSKLKIVVNESIFHPGHYRISLARRRNALPLDPAVTMYQTERGLRSQSAFIMTTPMPPIIVDGLWPHTEKNEANWETEITVPNITCEGCQLQVIQVMLEHPGVREGGFSYHHCAVLNITADPSKPNEDAKW